MQAGKPGKPKIKTGRRRNLKSKGLVNSGKAGPGSIVPKLLEAVLRWSLAVVILILILGGLSVKNRTTENVSKLDDQLTSLKIERDRLMEQVELFNDPAWREAYWKWQTMSHKPGEYYIEFIEPGSM